MVRLASLQCLLVVLLSVGLAACGGGAQMAPAGSPPVIRADESMVVFMRASALGGVIAASVFDVSGPETKFVGLVNYGTKFAHPVKPGEYTFMVIGESADFMKATVTAGRTYYALVTPRMGVWKARFSFRPLRLHELEGTEFASWSSATQFMANTPETQSWAVQNAADIHAKRAQYWPEWNAKPADQRASQTLNAEDGKPVPGATAAAAVPVAVAAAAPAPATAAPAAQVAASASSSRLPREGDSWTYRLTEKRSQAPLDYVARVISASSTGVVDQFSVEGATGTWTHKGERQVMPLGRSLFAPYLEVFSDHASLVRFGPVQNAEPLCGVAYLCQTTGRVAGKETLKTSAGTFETVKVEINQNWRPQAMSGTTGGQLAGGRRLTVWYAPEAKRAVKFLSRSTFGTPLSEFGSDFDLELVSYKLQ